MEHEMNCSVVDVLTKARGLVEKGWTTGHYARDSFGAECDYSFASCWCAEGALFASCTGLTFAEPGTEDDALGRAFNRMFDVIGSKHIPTWNDAPGRTQAEVLAAFDRAIELAKGAA